MVYACDHEDATRTQSHEIDATVAGLIVLKVREDYPEPKFTQQGDTSMRSASWPANREIAVDDTQHAHEMHATKRHIDGDEFDAESV